MLDDCKILAYIVRVNFLKWRITMKLWKRMIAVLLIVVMAVSVFAMAACDVNTPDNGDNGNNNGDNGNNGGNNNGDNNGNGNNNGNSSEESTVSAIVNALLKDGNKPFELNVTMTTDDTGDTYVMKADGTVYTDSETGFDGHSDSSKYNDVLLIKVLADLAKGKMDVIKNDTSVGEHHYYPASSEEEARDFYYSDAEVEYTFLRNWHNFNYRDYKYSNDKDNLAVLEEVTDWSDIVLKYKGLAIEGYEEMVAEYVDYVQRVNVIILNLANAANAVTIDGNKVVVDGNKLAYNMFNDVNSALSKITNNTTIGQLLNDPTVKKYLSSILNAFTVEEVFDILDDFGMLDNDIAKQLLAVKPDANSTTYDYIVKLIGSDELNDLISDMVKEELGINLPTNIANVKLSFILDLVVKATGLPVGTDLLDLAKTYVKLVADFVTETEIKVTDGRSSSVYQGDLTQTTTIKNAKMEYVLNSDKTIASQTFTVDIVESGVSGFGSVGEELFDITSGTANRSIKATMEYKDSVVFTDINGCAVEYYTQEFTESEYDESFEFSIYDNEKDCYTQEPLKGNLHVEISNGSVYELLLTDDDGEVLWSANVILYGNGHDAMLRGVISVTLPTYNYETGTESEETFIIEIEARVSSTHISLDFFYNDSNIDWVYIEAQVIYCTNTVSGVLNGEDWTKTAAGE